MRHDQQHPNQKGRRHRPLGRTALLAAWLLTVGMLATACSRGSSGPGVAGAGSSSSPSASPAGDNHEAQLAYAGCMRDHGITDFPDPPPQSGSGIQIHEGPHTHLGRDTPQFQAADQACHSLLPPGSGKKMADVQEQALAYSQCMRDHGISGFPDPVPDPGGGWIIPRNGEYDPLDPAVQAADEACLQSLRDADTSPTEAPGD